MGWKRWESYANIPQKEAYRIFTSLLKRKRIEFNISRKAPNYMYDAKNEQIQITTDDFIITLIYVSADPITRVFNTLLNTEKNFDGITFLSMNYNKNADEELSSILQAFVNESSNVPWNITMYPRFRFAVLLQLITKYKWKRFLTSSN